MTQRVDDDVWVAHLDRHRHGPGGGPCRECTSYEQGRAGAELWVARHEARLRDEVAKIVVWREAIRGNRLAKNHLKPPFPGMEGEESVRPLQGRFAQIGDLINSAHRSGKIARGHRGSEDA